MYMILGQVNNLLRTAFEFLRLQNAVRFTWGSLGAKHVLRNASLGLRLVHVPIVPDLGLCSPVGDLESLTRIRACTRVDYKSQVNVLFLLVFTDSEIPEAAATVALSLPEPEVDEDFRLQEFDEGNPAAQECQPSADCVVGKTSKATLGVSHEEGNNGAIGATRAFQELIGYFKDETRCTKRILLCYANGTMAGLYVGAEFARPATVSAILDKSG
ncbi:hypothetical protein MN608_02539 [Microdochium nivale]|nr:hypothetical protein MN608_02539 [Microdochium nivale]